MTRLISLVLLGLIIFMGAYVVYASKKTSEKGLAGPLEENLTIFGFENWHEFASPDGDFKVMLPSLPQHASDMIKDKNSGEERKYDMFVSEKPDGSVFMINVITFLTPPDEKQKDLLRRTMMNDVLKSNPDNNLLKAETTTFKDHPALDYTIENAEISVDSKVFVTNHALYALTRLVKKERHNQKEFDFFTNSFDLSK